MPNFNIHWKGYPHHRLPRVRVSSTSGASVRSRHITRIVPADSIRQSLRIELERERKKQKFAFRRRRGQKSRSSSSAARARKHASLRARQHIQVFGWDADIASKTNTLHNESAPSSIKARAGSRSLAAPEVLDDTITQTTIIDSHDGAASSAFRCGKPSQPENLYSLVHVAEVPVYWTKNKPVNRKRSSIASSRALTRPGRRLGQYANVGPIDLVSRRRTYRTPRQVGRSRTYDSRIDPRTLLDRDRLTKSIPTNAPATTRRTVSRPSPDKSWQGNPELRRTLESKVSKVKEAPQSVTPSMKSIVQTLLSDSASRTASQRKALKQFTKELELYLQAAKSLPKQNLVPSPSATTVSAHTVEELRPYQAQLRSAGLAVTSADQRRESSTMAKLKKPPSLPPTPPKDGKYTSRRLVQAKSKLVPLGDDMPKTSGEAHHHPKTGSVASFDTGTTVMDFTPPHEQTGSRAARDKRRSSSDHTIMAFTPPHEKPPPQPKSAPPPPPRASAKKSLPWLRNKESFETSPSPSPKKKGIVTTNTAQAQAQNPSDVLLSFSVAKNSAAEKPADRPKERMPSEFEHRNTEVKFQDMQYKYDPRTANAVDKRRFYNDDAMQAAPELLDDHAIADQYIKYTDATTQTNLMRTGSSNSREQRNIEDRPPLIKNKSKTFPISPKNCAGDCSQSVPKVPGEKSPRKRYRDQAVQTEIVDKSLDVKPSGYESKRPSFKSIPEIPDVNHTFPFASPSPFQRSPAQRSPNKSVDEVAVRQSRARIESAEPYTPAPKEPSRLPIHPGSLRCTQCSAEIRASAMQQQQQQQRVFTAQEAGSQPDSEAAYEPEAEPEMEPEPLLRGKWSHTCTARSSLECQQCAPRDVSNPVALQPESPVVSPRFLQQEYRLSPSRKDSQAQTTDWAATLDADLEEIIQGYHSPEERFIQRKVIQDTMAEYQKEQPVADQVKMSSSLRLRLRPPPTSQPVSKNRRPKSTAPAPSAPVFVDTGLPQSETITTSSSLTRDDFGISDRAVFRGLHVATAAACDEDVAKWIEEITGTGIRKFLADLSAFDGLGFNTLAGVAKRAAKQRRGELRAWERAREKRMREKELDEGWEDCAVEDGKQGRCKDRKMGFMAGDKTVNLREEKPAREESGKEVLDTMMKARECRSRENPRERTVRIGWRNRSVSGEV